MHAYPLAWLLLVGGCQSVAAPASAAPPHGQASFNTPLGTFSFEVEVAATERSREQGLMYRKSMAPNSGMVFVFPQGSPHTFWMKNTYIPLDMIFVTASHVVLGVVPSAEPLTLRGRGVPGDSKFVIELNGGTAAKAGITAGSTVSFTNVNEDPAE